MTKTAILFVDANKMLGERSVATVKITGVPLVKRILIDLRRAGMEKILVVMNERNNEIEAILDNTKVVLKRFLFNEDEWRAELASAGDGRVLVLTADRLSDFRFLQSFAGVRSIDKKVWLSVDLNDIGKKREAEKRFTPNDGKVIPADQLEGVRETGVYRFPAGTVAGFDEYSPEYIRKRVAEFEDKDEVGYFEIGNAFSIPIDSRRDRVLAERSILRYIWKEIDGVHSHLNKRIILPFIRLILKTPLTPNMISLIGALISLVSGYYFAKGYYVATIIGALLGLASSLLDHVDGSIARLKSMESNFGTYFESVCDYIYYFSFGVGLTVGLYRSTGNVTYLMLGSLAVMGIIISMVTTSYRRREYRVASTFSAHIQNTVTEERGNWLGFIVRNTSFIVRRAALPYYILIFTVLNALPFILFMLALSTNLFWMVQLLITRRHRPAEELRR